MAIDWNSPFAVKCPHCGEVIAMEVKAMWDAWDPRWEAPPQQWTAGLCPECSGTTIYLQEQLGQPFPDGWDGRYQVHPAQARRLSTSVPMAIRDDHAETTKCIESKLYTAAGVMTRRMLEGVCHDHGYNKGTLFAKLKKMKTDGVIDDRLYDWADICRDVGNQAAHVDKSTLTRDDAEEALRFVEALLDYLYVFRARYKEFKDRRDNP